MLLSLRNEKSYCASTLCGWLQILKLSGNKNQAFGLRLATRSRAKGRVDGCKSKMRTAVVSRCIQMRSLSAGRAEHHAIWRRRETNEISLIRQAAATADQKGVLGRCKKVTEEKQTRWRTRQLRPSRPQAPGFMMTDTRKAGKSES